MAYLRFEGYHIHFEFVSRWRRINCCLRNVKPLKIFNMDNVKMPLLTCKPAIDRLFVMYQTKIEQVNNQTDLKPDERYAMLDYLFRQYSFINNLKN